MDWFSRENLHRKPSIFGFSHSIWGFPVSIFPTKPIHWTNQLLITRVSPVFYLFFSWTSPTFRIFSARDGREKVDKSSGDYLKRGPGSAWATWQAWQAMANREIQLRRWENHRKIMVNILDHPRNIESMDWFKGTFTGNPHIQWENLFFPVDFPLNQSIGRGFNKKIRGPTGYKWWIFKYHVWLPEGKCVGIASGDIQLIHCVVESSNRFFLILLVENYV